MEGKVSERKAGRGIRSSEERIQRESSEAETARRKQPVITSSVSVLHL